MGTVRADGREMYRLLVGAWLEEISMRNGCGGGSAGADGN